jgi:nicotinate phosphoribosyltransferase
MEVEGKARAKRGKWSGSKRVLRCKKCGAHMIVPNTKNSHKCLCRKKMNDILIPVLDHGEQLVKTELPSRLRKTVLENIKNFYLD